MSSELDKKAQLFEALVELDQGRIFMTPKEMDNEHLRRLLEGEFTKPEPFGGIVFPTTKKTNE